jgi:hypothetical protein
MDRPTYVKKRLSLFPRTYSPNSVHRIGLFSIKKEHDRPVSHQELAVALIIFPLFHSLNLHTSTSFFRLARETPLMALSVKQ